MSTFSCFIDYCFAILRITIDRLVRVGCSRCALSLAGIRFKVQGGHSDAIRFLVRLNVKLTCDQYQAAFLRMQEW